MTVLKETLLGDERVTVNIKRVRPERDGDIPFPKYMSPSAAGMDLHAAVEKETPILPGEISLVPTGLAVSIPKGYEIQIRPRSGLAINHGIGIINSPGTVDADYRGEIKIALINFGKKTFIVSRGDRIAQMILARVQKMVFDPVEELDNTDRGDGGFGHTGL